MSDSPDRAILVALAALHRLATDAGDAPMQPDLRLRAILALLHARSDGRREVYDDFWRLACREGYEQHPSDGPRRYLRSTYMRIAWCGIVRTLGMEPTRKDLTDAVQHAGG